MALACGLVCLMDEAGGWMARLMGKKIRAGEEYGHGLVELLEEYAKTSLSGRGVFGAIHLVAAKSLGKSKPGRVLKSGLKLHSERGKQEAECVENPSSVTLVLAIHGKIIMYSVRRRPRYAHIFPPFLITPMMLLAPVMRP